MSSSLFTIPVVLFSAVEGGASFEMYLLIIWNMIDQAGPGLVLTLRCRSAGLRAALGRLTEENQSGVGIVKWPVAQVVRKQALHIKLSLY